MKLHDYEASQTDQRENKDLYPENRGPITEHPTLAVMKNYIIGCFMDYYLHDHETDTRNKKFIAKVLNRIIQCRTEIEISQQLDCVRHFNLTQGEQDEGLDKLVERIRVQINQLGSTHPLRADHVPPPTIRPSAKTPDRTASGPRSPRSQPASGSDRKTYSC